MKKYILTLLNAAVLLVAVNTISAATITQTHNFNFSGGPYTGTATGVIVVNNGDFVATVSPFDTALGALNAFTVEWDFDFISTFTINATPSGSGGVSAINVGGSFSIGGVQYDGTGGNPGNGGPAGSSHTVTFPVAHSQTFLPTTPYTGIWDAVTGPTDFDLLWETALTTFYSDVEHLNISATGSVKLTYDYTANAVPEPGTMLLLGFGLMGLGYVGRRQPELRP